jgi:hypothetical protein
MNDPLKDYDARLGMEVLTNVRENTPDEDWPEVSAAMMREEVELEHLGGTRIRVIVAGHVYDMEMRYEPPPGHPVLN